MKIIFIIIWVFILMSAWFATSTTILHVDNNSKTFKLKSIFYWLSIATTLFAGYYLIN